MSASSPSRAAPGSAGLDWRDSAHWSTALLPCVHCGERTNLRDDDGCPSHKICSEAATDVPDVSDITDVTDPTTAATDAGTGAPRGAAA